MGYSMERELLLLGLLRTGESHGYHLMEMLDQHVGLFIGLTKPTAYRLLEEMAREGWLSEREEREGKRPPRKVYTITPAGEKQFGRLLRDCLAQYQPVAYNRDVSLLFLETLPPQEAESILRQRQVQMSALREELSRSVEQHGGSSILAHHLSHLELDCDHVAKLINTLENRGGKPHG